MSTNIPVDSLFKELDNYIQKSDFDNVISIANKILDAEPKDSDAIHCKIVALIQQSKFEEVIALLDKQSNLKEHFKFQLAYCHYRLKNLKEALSILNSQPDPKPVNYLELLAQVYYRSENWDACLKIYDQLATEHKINTPELWTNVCAAYVSAGYSKEGEKLINSNKNLIKETFEFTYNAGCVAIEAGQFSEAEKLLKLAQDICRNSLKEEGSSDEEIEDELAIIHTQLAYIYQMLNRIDEALQLYNHVVKTKPTDDSISAVASNNIVVIKKEHILFDSLKKMKQATSQALESKLTTTQKKIIGFNHCLLLLYMNKGDQCRELLKMLEEQFPDSDRLALISAALLHREKQVQKSEELLKEFAKQHPNNNILVQLSLAQMHLEKGNILEAISALESITSLKNKAGMAATLVSLYEQVNNIDAAITTFDNFIATINKKDNEDEYIRLLKECANFKLKHKRYRDAASSFEKVLALYPTDLQALPGLVISLSQFDPAQAERWEMKLPKLKTDVEVDAQTLENLAAPRITKKEDIDTKGDEKKNVAQKKAKKKRKPRKLKKPIDPTKPLDPERWIPMKERSYYRHHRNRRNRKGIADRAAQGVQDKRGPVITPNTPVQATPSEPKSPTQETKKEQQPQQPGKQQAGPGKKKKGKGGR